MQPTRPPSRRNEEEVIDEERAEMHRKVAEANKRSKEGTGR